MSNKRAKVLAMLAMAVTLTGCEHALVGNATALLLTLGLFVGTLNLGRTGIDARRGAEVSSATPRTGS